MHGCYAVLGKIVDTDLLIELFQKRFGYPPKIVEKMRADLGASGRQLYRLKSDAVSSIGVIYGVREENAAFLEFSRHFFKCGLRVPEIYGQDLEQGAYLEEDLGDVTLYDFLSRNRDGVNVSQATVDAYRKVVRELPRFQV